MSNGYILVYGNCASCYVPIAYNPLYVPSIRVYNKGEKQAICKACFKRWNDIHRPNKPLEIHPKAYSPLKKLELDTNKDIQINKHTGTSNKNNGVKKDDDR